MGSIRTILALSVVFGHAGAIVFTGGQLAVQLFYVISGYLMSLIILGKSYNTIKHFYFNRFLRLFPVYWVVALITLFVYFFCSTESSINFFNAYSELGSRSIWLFLTNIFLIGQDWIMFTGVTDGIFKFTTNFRDSEVQVWHGLLVPQAWTLGVELSFYAIAPFILKNWRYWITILIFSIILRVYLVYIGIGTKDPFTYRFFPLELALFLFGVSAHQIVKPIYAKYNILDNLKIIKFSTFFIMILVLCFHLIPIHIYIKTLILLSIFTLSLPLLASFQLQNRFDNNIGNLSYPIYICHWIVIDVLKLFFNREIFFQNLLFFFSVVSITILFAFLLEKLVNKKIDILRKHIRRQSR